MKEVRRVWVIVRRLVSETYKLSPYRYRMLYVSSVSQRMSQLEDSQGRRTVLQRTYVSPECWFQFHPLGQLVRTAQGDMR